MLIDVMAGVGLNHRKAPLGIGRCFAVPVFFQLSTPPSRAELHFLSVAH